MSTQKPRNPQNNEPKHGNDKEREAKPSDFYKYSGMTIKMGVVIFAGVYGGQKLDVAMGNKNPWMTIVLSLVSVAIAIYFVISDTNK